MSADDRLRGPALARALFAPASIALLGASDDPGKTSGRPLQFLRRAGYAGRIYPVNPRRAQVLGERAWPSLAELPEIPEQVFILTGTDTILASVADCAARGVRIATVLASGFAEAGEQGRRLQQQLQALAQRTGIRIIGPSSLGIVRPDSGLLLTANAAFAEPGLPGGRFLVASQSGSMIGALVSRGKARGVGFAGLISVGGEVDVSLGEICLAMLDDPQVDGFLLFLENLHHGATLRRFALAAAQRGKPVLAYKLGRSQAAAEMSATHTGAIAGEDDVADAFLRDCGIARLTVFDSLLEAIALAPRMPLSRAIALPRRPRIGVVTTTGGGAAMLVDQLGIRDVEVAGPTADTAAQLKAAGVEADPGRVLDLTLAGTRYEVMKASLDTFLAAPEFDMVVAVVGSSARFNPQLAVRPIIDSIGADKPLAAMLVPDAPDAHAALTAASVPNFRTPEACGDSIAAMFARRDPRSLQWPAALCDGTESAGSAGSAESTGSTEPAHCRALSEQQAYRLLDELGVARAPTVLLPLTTGDADLPLRLPFDYPIAVKVCSASVPHKTEIGGVVLGVNDREALALAMQRMRALGAQHGLTAAEDGALLQPMRRGVVEALVGYRVDADAGPIVMLAAGGIWAELARDRSIRLAPVSVDSALQMIDEVRALHVARGLRGQPRGDLAALARAISALSQLALRPEVLEAEINPMMVMPEATAGGAVAVDALVIVRA